MGIKEGSEKGQDIKLDVSIVVCLPLIALPAFLNVLFENQTTFAQPENQTPESIVRPPGSFGETSTPADNATRINHPDSEFPILEKESDKGLYTVQLRFTTFSLLPRYGFDMEILFFRIHKTLREPVKQSLKHKRTSQHNPPLLVNT